MSKTFDDSRRSALKKMAGSAAVAIAGMSLSHRVQATERILDDKLKGKINHSVCRWCYNDIPFEDLCKAANAIGLASIELTGPDEWPILKRYGLTAAMGWSAEKGITEGFNNPALHDELVTRYTELIPKAAAAGITQLICFSGNRRGLGDEKGIENCAVGLKRLMGVAEQYKITLAMELLNSKFDHHDYQCDRTEWGVALCEKIGSDRFKLLYDIYHMQIMEGDVIATIRKHAKYISHFHTGGVPGRAEIDDTQELNYPAIMRAIVETGFKGYVGQEFIPRRADKIASLKQGVTICDVK